MQRVASVHTLVRHLTGSCGIPGIESTGGFERRFGGYADLFSSRAAVCLVEAVGMEAGTATADEMDDNGAIFVCGKCPEHAERFTGTWRECVSFLF